LHPLVFGLLKAPTTLKEDAGTIVLLNVLVPLVGSNGCLVVVSVFDRYKN